MTPSPMVNVGAHLAHDLPLPLLFLGQPCSIFGQGRQILGLV
jgi:hypothetical protein